MKIIYQAFDGRTFGTERDCRDYEFKEGQGRLLQLMARESKFFANQMTDEVRNDILDAIISNRNLVIEILESMLNDTQKRTRKSDG